MKTNLDAMYKTDDASEKEGIWFQVGEKTKFMLRRFGGKNSLRYKKAMAKHHKPFAPLMAKGVLSEEQEYEITVKVFVETSLVTWEGVEVDGKEYEFTPENAVNLLVNLPDLGDMLIAHATDADNYKDPREEVGNS